MAERPVEDAVKAGLGQPAGAGTEPDNAQVVSRAQCKSRRASRVAKGLQGSASRPGLGSTRGVARGDGP
eukprot:1162433-Lingulodinium_polyedra.AAC.1